MGAFVCFCFSCYSVYAEPRCGSLYSISKPNEESSEEETKTDFYLNTFAIQTLQARSFFLNIANKTGNQENMKSSRELIEESGGTLKFYARTRNASGTGMSETLDVTELIDDTFYTNISTTNKNNMIKIPISGHSIYDIVIISNYTNADDNGTKWMDGVIKFIPDENRELKLYSNNYYLNSGMKVQLWEIANDTDHSIKYGLSMDTLGNKCAYKPIYYGNRNYMNQDLYEILFPTSPEVDAINYKADRILEAMQTSNTEISHVVSYLEQLHVLSGSMDNKLDTLSDIYTTNTFIESGVNEANENIEIVQEKIDTTNENIENLTNEDIAQSAIDSGIDDAEQEVNDDLFLPVLQSPIAIQASPTTWLDYFTVVPETSRVGLPCPFKPEETFYVDFGAFFEYNQATYIFFTFIRWFLRYRVIIAAGDYLIKAIERLLGVAIISEFLPRMKV